MFGRPLVIMVVSYVLTVGTVALCIWLLLMGLRQLKVRSQFSLRSLFIAITIVAVIGGGWSWIRNQYYWQLNALNAVLASHPEVTVVHMLTNEDVCLEVEVVVFSVAGDAGKTFRIVVPHDAGESEISSLLNHALLAKQPISAHFGNPSQ